MKFEPNIGKPVRIAYVILGLVMAAVPFAMGMEGWTRTVLPILGGVTLVTGAVGW